MPFTGGTSPSPERYGGGDGNTNVPTLQRVFESISGQRGSAYDQTWPPATAVGAENMALARAITFDLHGGNTRLANEFNPGMATVGGLLPRWEAILGTPPLPGDSQPVRQARVSAAFARLGVANSVQAVVDQVSAALGPLYGGITNFAPPDSAIWPGVTGTAAKITAFSANLVTVANLANVPSSSGGMILQLSNCATTANNGQWPIHTWISTSSVQVANPAGVSTDYGVGGTSGSPTINWQLISTGAPWTSMTAQVDILALLPTGYYTLNGSGQKVPNAAWWSRVATINPILDAMLPAWATWCIYALNSSGVSGFLLDDPANLDVEIFSV